MPLRVAHRFRTPGLLVFALLRKFAEEMDRAFSPKPLIGRDLGLRPRLVWSGPSALRRGGFTGPLSSAEGAASYQPRPQA